jgi:non-ribosomal peptide synthetase component F
MLGHLITVLTALPDSAEGLLRDLPLLSDEERVALRTEPASTFAPDRCLHERFEERVRSGSQRVAVVCDGESLTYEELDRRANALAWRLTTLGVGPDVLVGIRTNRSLSIVVGILGILKAGGAYLPLDPAYPKDRVDFMLADSGVDVVVTETEFARDFEGRSELVLLDRERDRALKRRQRTWALATSPM